MVTVELTQIFRYPIKSTRREALTSASVQPWGLAGDRRWMRIDPDGRFITARETAPLLLIHASQTANGIRVSSPGRRVWSTSTTRLDDRPTLISAQQVTASVLPV